MTRMFPLVVRKVIIRAGFYLGTNLREASEGVNIVFISPVCAKPSMTEEKNVEPEQPSTSRHVTEEELEDWLDSMIS